MKDKHRVTVYAVVSGMFARFIDSEMRGPNFEWSNFPDMVAEYTASTFFIYLKDGEKFNEEEVKQDAKLLATHLCKSAKLI